MSREALRARNPEYYDKLTSIGTEALWAMNKRVADGPYRPHVWRYRETLPALEMSKDIYTMGESHEDRRALNLLNPNGELSAPTIAAGIQLIYPGESAACHRHTPSAARFMISGHGGYTVQAGQKFRMEPGDLILTPSWIWHDHGNDGSEPSIWQDYTDVAFYAWGGFFNEDLPEIQQVSWPYDLPEANMRYVASGMSPAGDRSASVNSPQWLYRWKHAEAAARAVAVVGSDLHDGAIVEYVNPLTGGHCLSSQAHYLMLLPLGFHGTARRCTEHVHYFVVRGSGRSVINGKEYAWEENDTFLVPSWSWCEHIADQETFLLKTSDLPLREPFGIHRMENYPENGGYQLGD